MGHRNLIGYRKLMGHRVLKKIRWNFRFIDDTVPGNDLMDYFKDHRYDDPHRELQWAVSRARKHASDFPTGNGAKQGLFAVE